MTLTILLAVLFALMARAKERRRKDFERSVRFDPEVANEDAAWATDAEIEFKGGFKRFNG